MYSLPSMSQMREPLDRSQMSGYTSSFHSGRKPAAARGSASAVRAVAVRRFEPPGLRRETRCQCIDVPLVGR